MENENYDVNAVSEMESAEETTETSSEPSSEPKVEKEVPYSRFKEVNDQLKSLKTEITKLTQKEIRTELSDTEKKDLDAKQYLKGLLEEVMNERESKTTQVEQAELAKFNQDVDEVLELNPDIKRDDFLKFIEEKADKYGVDSIKGAMLLYKDFNQTVEGTKQSVKKELASRPKFPTSEGVSIAKVDDSGKSIWQIAAEAARELETKK